MGQDRASKAYHSQFIHTGGRSWLMKPDLLEAPDLEDVEILIENKMAARSRKADIRTKDSNSMFALCSCSYIVLFWIVQ